MANPVYLLPPERFDFGHPDTWPSWVQRFERYRVVLGLSDKDEQIQIIYAMGGEAEDILGSFGLSERDSGSFSVVQERFSRHFRQAV